MSVIYKIEKLDFDKHIKSILKEGEDIIANHTRTNFDVRNIFVSENGDY